MHKQHPNPGRRRPWVRLATTGAIAVLIAGILASVGYVNYHLWAYPGQPVFPTPDPVAELGPWQAPASASFPQQTQASQNGRMSPLPPQPTGEAVSSWRQAAAMRPPPPQAPRQHSTDDLVAAVDKAFAEPAAELKPAVVFFPAADGSGKVRPDGYVLGEMAALAATYTPHRRLALSTPFLHDELIVADCLNTGVLLDPEMIALTTAALETKLYVLTRLESGDGKDELTVEFHGDGKTYPDRTFRHPIPAEGLRTAPGLVARDVLEALGVSLDAAELQTVLEPNIQDDRELANLNQVLRIYPATSNEDAWLEVFLSLNTHCVFGWEQYLMNGHNEEPAEVLKRFAKAQPPCDQLQIDAARLLRNSGRAEDALLALLKLAPSHHGDSSYHSTLTRCGIALADQRLANHLFEVWEKAGPEYAGCLERAKLLTEWAWMARGGGWANTVTDEGWKLFHERLGRAQHELELAVKRDPSGYRAHVDLMRVARGLGLPHEFMEEHFKAAVRAQPHLLSAYTEKWEYLRPRWNGNNEELLAFGKECLETGAWSEGIPELCESSIKEVSSEMPDDSLRLALKAGPLWDLLLAYYQAAEKHADPALLTQAREAFARMGVLGEHFDEVAPAYQKLEERGVPVSGVFVDQGEYEYFCELVHARTGKLATRSAGRKRDRALCRASVALATGDLDEAEKDLAQVEQGKDDPERLAERYRGAIALGRKLRADGSVTLLPQQVKDICVTWGQERWTVEGNALIGKKLYGVVSLVLPLALQDATITGTIFWEGDFNTVEMQVHARSPRPKVRMFFYPHQEKATLLSDYRVVAAQAPYEPGPQKFRLELGADEDHLEPASGLHWPLPADDLPGCFALHLWANVGDATCTISDLRIELKK